MNISLVFYKGKIKGMGLQRPKYKSLLKPHIT